jgi:hypothetical protein
VRYTRVVTKQLHRAGFAYFGSLTVENVRCFAGPEQLLLRLGDRIAKWTVILGDNGVGKTSLLQCLRSLAPISGHESGAAPAAASWSTWPNDPGPNLAHALARTPVDTVRLAASIAVDTPLRQPVTQWHAFDFSEEWRDKPVTIGWTGRSYRTMQGVAVDMFVCGFGAGRKPGRTEIAADTCATLFDDDVRLVDAEKWYQRFDYAAKSENSPQSRERLERVHRALTLLLPDVEDLRVTGLDLADPEAKLEARTPYGWVRVRNLSLGYRTLMAWTVEFAARMFARYPDSKNPLAEPAVCLVDEIDLHLHPTWQRKLIAHLDQLFPNTQFIVTAHSPLVVQAAENAKVAVLRRDPSEDFATIHNDLDAVRGWRVDQILTSDLFGLDGSRSPKINELMDERARLLRQSELDADDRRRVAEIDAELDDLPLGDTAEDRHAWDFVRRFAGDIADGSVRK